MMKGLKEQTLSVEQMQHLRELHVDTTKASVVLIYKDDMGNEVEWDDVKIIGGVPHYVEYDGQEDELWANYLDAETGDYDHSYRESCGVFTLQDMLEMLPTDINSEDRNWRLACDMDYDVIFYASSDRGYLAAFQNMKLIAAYEMLCWVAENGYLNASNSMQ